MRGSDGAVYPYLLKGKDGLRLVSFIFEIVYCAFFLGRSLAVRFLVLCDGLLGGGALYCTSSGWPEAGEAYLTGVGFCVFGVCFGFVWVWGERVWYVHLC
jgi:hypothetical protein